MAGLSGPATVLLNRRQSSVSYFKAKSDYVAKPLTREAIGGALSILERNTRGWMIFTPYGGVMEDISQKALPFPHRSGALFDIQYQAVWPAKDGFSDQDSLIAWVRGLYNYMSPFVSYFPSSTSSSVGTSSSSRAAYVNYIDLDLGNGSSAGKHYFGPNFARLVQIKRRIDPTNIFHQPQSIPTSLSP
jgi:hypothetical protein